MPKHIILFRDEDFRGPHKHVFDLERNLNFIETDGEGQVIVRDDAFNEATSSMAILSGNWRFFKKPELQDGFDVVLGPGLYRSMGPFKLEDNRIVSLVSVDEPPTMPGAALEAHVVLFQHANFRGDHRHVFGRENDLSNNSFAGLTSSVVVKLGNWSFFKDVQFVGHFDPVLGPGIYPWVEEVGIDNDTLASLRPTVQTATLSNSVANEIILFEQVNFRGAHKHVFAAEPNLNGSDDQTFNDQVSSVIVLDGTWSFFRDSQFIGEEGHPLGVGTYTSVTDQGISDNDISSLRPTVKRPGLDGRPIRGEAILFEHRNFLGQHRHVFNEEANLNADDDDSMNDAVASMVIVSGNWQFFQNAGFDDDYPVILGPGLYSHVSQVSISDHGLSSLRVVDQPATTGGVPLNTHMVLFEHLHLRGQHRHLFSSWPFLNVSGETTGPTAESFVIEKGNWQFFMEDGFTGALGPVLGPGVYPHPGTVGVAAGDHKSAEPTSLHPTRMGQLFAEHAMLFEHANFRGAHKHLFASEPNLNSDEDNDFNDEVSSIAVLMDIWRAYRDANYVGEYDVVLLGGLYPWVEEVGIKDNDLSSMRFAGDPL